MKEDVLSALCREARSSDPPARCLPQHLYGPRSRIRAAAGARERRPLLVDDAAGRDDLARPLAVDAHGLARLDPEIRRPARMFILGPELPELLSAGLVLSGADQDGCPDVRTSTTLSFRRLM